jgi:hypothetical protein
MLLLLLNNGRKGVRQMKKVMLLAIGAILLFSYGCCGNYITKEEFAPWQQRVTKLESDCAQCRKDASDAKTMAADAEKTAQQAMQVCTAASNSAEASAKRAEAAAERSEAAAARAAKAFELRQKK